MRTHDHHDQIQDSLSTREFLKAFHGHLGPYVVLGYRMGRLALEESGSQGHFDISAKVYTNLTPPPSCLIDGVQLGSGCTLGKRNIEVHATGGTPYAVFATKDGLNVTIRLRPEIPSLIATLVDEKGVESAGKFFLEKEWQSLFEVAHN